MPLRTRHLRAALGAAAALATIGLTTACGTGATPPPAASPSTDVTPTASAPASSPSASPSPDLKDTQVATTWQEAVKAAQAKFSGRPTGVSLDWERNELVYTVDLVSDTEEYEATVNAASGEVVHSDTDRLDADDVQDAKEDVFDPAKVVDLSKAMDAALAQAKGRVTEWSLEGSRRGVFFQFDIVDGTKDVEAIVDATTGEFVRIDT